MGAQHRNRRGWACGVVLVALLGAACARSAEAWLADLDHPDPFVRALAALALSEQGGEHAAAALPVLLETVDRTELGLEPQASAALAHIAPRVAEGLIESLLTDEFMTSERRVAVLRALEQSGESGAYAIVAALRGSARKQAGDLGVLLVRIGPAAVPALIELVSDGSQPRLQGYAAFVLGQLGAGARTAGAALQALSDHPDPAVRAVIVEALQRIESAGAGLPGPADASERGR